MSVVVAGTKVYPRACGGTLKNPVGAIVDKGLSPRVRGNLCFLWCYDECWRSIPARAGEPPVR